jgi:hypothetical protein
LKIHIDGKKSRAVIYKEEYVIPPETKNNKGELPV